MSGALTAPREVRGVLERLEDARQRWWLFSLGCNVLLLLTVSLALCAVCVGIDVVWPLKQVGLAILLGIWLAATAAMLGAAVYRLVRYQRNLEATARRVEAGFPQAGSDLINIVHLSRRSSEEADSFMLAALSEAVRRVEGLAFHRAATAENRLGRWRLALQTPRDLAEHAAVLVLLIVLLTGIARLVPTWPSAVDRFFSPWQFVPQVGAIQIEDVVPGNAEVLLGSRLEIAATIAPPTGQQPRGTLWWTRPGKPEESRTMVADASGVRFALAIPAVLEPFSYRLQIGDSQSREFHIGVRDKPAMAEVEVTYDYPAYLERPAETVHQQHADLDAPQYTTARLRIHSPSRLGRGFLQLGERRVFGKVLEDQRTLEATLPLTETGSYIVQLFNELDQADPDPRINSIRVIPDVPPTIQIVQPAPDAKVALGESVTVVVRAGDDYGLAEVTLQWKTPGTGEAESDAVIHSVHTWDRLGAATASTLQHALRLEAPPFAADSTILVRAVARDRRHVAVDGVRLAPQETATAWLPLRLVAREQQAAEALERIETIHTRLWQLLTEELRTRAAAAELLAPPEMERATAVVFQCRDQQQRLLASAQELTATLADASDEEVKVIRRVLNNLVAGDFLQAVQQAEALTNVGLLSTPKESVQPLLDTQDRIIAALRALLDQTRLAAAEALADMPSRRGGDLPPDATDKLRELAERLREFLEQQKRVIEATQSLAKKPVEDFTQEDEQELAALAAVEDQFARFLAEAHADFSRLPEQDFSNPSLLEEMVEVQNELKMAADALTQKAADIAVPLEQLGAEMAEEMTTNIEKWLPNTPDRERWSQEEPLTDAMKEAPMAELPGELEDLVGDLMEEEEDLLEELEDASSSWADSIDKGAGWDAMDGPISNMSARGVTGNRLPNSSEIGGRSGEGRQGKSSGEFVGDSAEGKGGRRTPSRLAPDPYVAGKVDDRSRDPVGGATGGGKESGVGGAGLEGPVPPNVERELARMAQRQAELRNQAEGVDLKFQVLNFHRTDLQKMIAMMEAVERDLRSGRYQNALRRREVLLENMDNIKSYLGGEYAIRRDESSNLPEDIQKELLGGMQDEAPAGWEEWNRRYFERLSSDPAASPHPADAARPAQDSP